MNDRSEHKRNRKIKEFEELTITDDFMFGIIDMIDNNPDWSDEDIAVEISGE